MSCFQPVISALLVDLHSMDSEPSAVCCILVAFHPLDWLIGDSYRMMASNRKCYIDYYR
jgi:hypothetical protein